jgi:hypothetical protein
LRLIEPLMRGDQTLVEGVMISEIQFGFQARSVTR